MSNILQTVALVVGLMTPAGYGLKYYADHEYLGLDDWRIAAAQSDERALKKEIRDLKYDIDKDLATDKDRWEYQRLLEDLEDLQDQINQLQ